jgi:hypothetical protein
MDTHTGNPRRRGLLVMLLGIGVFTIAIGIVVAVSGFGQRRLVEVFDNGPVGGSQGPSEGYIWVREDDLPAPGKTWAPVDPATLTADQKKRIR